MRRILGHIHALPPDSATIRSRMTPELAWDQTHELLAGVIDLLRLQHATYLNAHGVNTDMPDPLPRPGQTVKEIPTISLAEWTATL